jgi:hypothetical protein
VKRKRNYVKVIRKRYAGDWLPVDNTSKRKGKAKRRFVAPKSEFELRSERNRRNSL